MAEALILLACALLGAGMSFHMTSKYYRLRNADASPDDKSVVQSPYARVFGVPNSLLGFLFYAGIGSLSVYRLAAGRWMLLLPAFVCAVASVLFSVYLLWSLLYKVKESCKFCFTSHLLNLIIAIVLAVELFSHS